MVHLATFAERLLVHFVICALAQQCKSFAKYVSYFPFWSLDASACAPYLLANERVPTLRLFLKIALFILRIIVSHWF